MMVEIPRDIPARIVEMHERAHSSGLQRPSHGEPAVSPLVFIAQRAPSACTVGIGLGTLAQSLARSNDHYLKGMAYGPELYIPDGKGLKKIYWGLSSISDSDKARVTYTFQSWAQGVHTAIESKWAIMHNDRSRSCTSLEELWQGGSEAALYAEQVFNRVLPGVLGVFQNLFYPEPAKAPKGMSSAHMMPGYTYTTWAYISSIMSQLMKSVHPQVQPTELSQEYRDKLQDIFQGSSFMTGYLQSIPQSTPDFPDRMPPDLVLEIMEHSAVIIGCKIAPTSDVYRAQDALQGSYLSVSSVQIAETIRFWVNDLVLDDISDLPDYLLCYLRRLPRKAFDEVVKYYRMFSSRTNNLICNILSSDGSTPPEQAEKSEVQVVPAEPEPKDLTPADAAPEPADAAPEGAPPAEAEQTTEPAEVQVVPAEPAPEPVCAETTIKPKPSPTQQAQFLSTLGIHSLLQQQCRQLESRLNQLSQQGDEYQAENNPAQPALEGLEQITKDRFAALTPEEAQQALERIKQSNQALLKRFSQLTCQLHKLQTIS